MPRQETRQSLQGDAGPSLSAGISIEVPLIPCHPVKANKDFVPKKTDVAKDVNFLFTYLIASPSSSPSRTQSSFRHTLVLHLLFTTVL